MISSDLRYHSDQLLSIDSSRKDKLVTKSAFETSNLVDPVHVSDDDLRRIFHSVLDDQILSVSKLERSSYRRVFGIQSDRKRYVIRINPYPHYCDGSLLVDALARSVLGTRGYVCTTSIVTDITRDEFEIDFDISERIDGELLYDISHDSQSKSFVHLGRALRRLHDIDADGYGLVSIVELSRDSLQGLHRSWRSFLELSLAQELQILEQRVGRKIWSIDKRTMFHLIDSVQYTKRGSVLHGDIANHNAIDYTDGCSLIDWEDLIIGDPLYDLAYYASGAYGNDHWLSALLEGYRNLSIDDVFSNRDFWVYYGRIVLSKTIQRILFKPGSSKDTALDTWSIERLKFVDKLLHKYE